MNALRVAVPRVIAAGVSIALVGCAVAPATFYADPAAVGDTRLCRTLDKAASSNDWEFLKSVRSEVERRGLSDAQCRSLENRQTGLIVAGTVLAAVVVAAARSGGGGGGGGYDSQWDWDQFYGSSGQLQWECRGVQTGQFAQAYHCAGLPMTDARWPGK